METSGWPAGRFPGFIRVYLYVPVTVHGSWCPRDRSGPLRWHQPIHCLCVTLTLVLSQAERRTGSLVGRIQPLPSPTSLYPSPPLLSTPLHFHPLFSPLPPKLPSLFSPPLCSESPTQFYSPLLGPSSRPSSLLSWTPLPPPTLSLSVSCSVPCTGDNRELGFLPHHS